MQPVTDALSQIMAYAPAGWTVRNDAGHSAYTSTLGTVYRQFAGESVLAALCEVAENLGEHFYAIGQELIWLRKDSPDSGIRAMADVDPVAAEADDTLCIITALTETQDAAGIYSRIYPHGGGVGEKR